MKRILLLAVYPLALACPVLPAAALTKCIVGQQVADPRGGHGAIVWGGGDFCRVRYEGGQTYGWAAADLRVPESPPKSDHANSSSGGDETLILRPSGNALVYHADALGHFRLTAAVNGAPVHFIVDTGATFVSLSLDDAAAAGIERGSLSFTAKTITANGTGRSAPVQLREVRVGQISINNVSALVGANLTQSLLGMSLLNRLKGFEIREGLLTINR